MTIMITKILRINDRLGFSLPLHLVIMYLNEMKIFDFVTLVSPQNKFLLTKI